MRARIHPEKLAIQHVRHGRKGMPVLGMNVGEGPSDPLPAQPCPNVRIVVNIKWIVIVDELMAERLPENGPRDRD